MELSLIQKIAVSILPILFAITVHEVAHGYVANKFGDPTAKMLGRLTLNPIKHIDPIGTIVVPGILLILGGFIFGWAKPVPVTWQNLKHPRRDMALVALAGPFSNLLMAVFWAGLLHIIININPQLTSFGVGIALMCQIGVTINLILMVLNILPCPPLDGSRVLASFLPPRIAYQYNRIEPYGFFILLLLLVTGILGKILEPMVDFFYKLLL